MVEKRFNQLGIPDIERFENYLPTAFSSELTLLQKVNKIIQDLIRNFDLTNEMVDYLNNFIETFDENLYETVDDILNEWLKNDKLAKFIRDLINEEVIEARTDNLGKKYVNLKERLDSEKADIVEVTKQLAHKANKDEVTNIMTPKGNKLYNSLPTTGNTIGDYYYCPDGDGVNGAGNYVWNGTAWYFGGAGDEGYNKLKEDLDNREYRIANCDTLVSSKNLCDYTKVQHGKYISDYNEETKEIEYIGLKDRGVSPFIPVEIGKKYTFYGNFGTDVQGLLFDKNFNFLSRVYKVTDSMGIKVTGSHGNYLLEITEKANPDIMYFIFSSDDTEQRMMLLEDTTTYPSELIKYNPAFKSQYVKDAVINVVKSSASNKLNSGVVSCYGDSLTAGAGVGSVYNDTYCGQLASLLGVTVNRCGVGGEGVEQIAMRQGGQALYAKPFTIPSNKDTVNIELVNAVGEKVIIGYQGYYTEWGINPVRINGIEGILNYDRNSGSNTFTRSKDGTVVNVTRNTLVISNAFINYINDITVIWAGTNGTKDLSDVPYLINIINSMVNALNTKCYIIIGLMTVADGYIPNKVTMESVNSELQNHYGYHYLDVYQYLLSYGLADCNISPTGQDNSDINNGKVPSSLRYDAVHLNKNGYSVIANLLAKRIKTLGWL